MWQLAATTCALLQRARTEKIAYVQNTTEALQLENKVM